MKTTIVENPASLISSFEQKKRDIAARRRQEEERKTLALQVKEKNLINNLDRIEKEISHRELFDSELREAIRIAAEKRVDASYRDLISSVDVMKKHLNIIDGVDNQTSDRVIVIPSALFSRDAKVVEGEIQQEQKTICKEQQTQSLTA
jgi:hypothetical protein